LQTRAQNKETVQAAEKPKATKKGKKGKKNKKQKETEKAEDEGATLLELAEMMTVVEAWTEVVSSLVMGGLGIL
jgi:hypothetical protein